MSLTLDELMGVEWPTEPTDQARDELEFEKVKITPPTAARWLRWNPINRKLNQEAINALAQVILRGEWDVNADTIKFTRHGYLMDGQHRLSAVVKANEPITSFVARGLEPVSMLTLDQGRMRRLSDFLQMRGELNSEVLAGAINFIWSYERHGVIHKTRGERKPSVRQALELLVNRPDIPHSVSIGMRIGKSLKGGSGLWAACHHICAQIDPQDADEFFSRTHRGDLLLEGDPIYALRERFFALQRSGERTTPYYRSNLIFKAWNAWRHGEQIQILRFVMGGTRAEQPVIPV